MSGRDGAHFANYTIEETSDAHSCHLNRLASQRSQIQLRFVGYLLASMRRLVLTPCSL
jgi:PHP family Zn ribbon phosphoesterase